jgi:2-methylisocitrate lyase-like PEP mutase family enzyme
MEGKLRAAIDARHESSTLILARTDALAIEGFEKALERAERYLECGADAIFIEAVRTPQEMDIACQRFASRAPMLANMVEGGKTPIQSAQELGARGYKIVIFPGGTARAVAHTLKAYYVSLKQHQTTLPWQTQMLDFDGLNEVIGTNELLNLGKKYDNN